MKYFLLKLLRLFSVIKRAQNGCHKKSESNLPTLATSSSSVLRPSVSLGSSWRPPPSRSPPESPSSRSLLSSLSCCSLSAATSWTYLWYRAFLSACSCAVRPADRVGVSPPPADDSPSLGCCEELKSKTIFSIFFFYARLKGANDHD